MKRRSEMRPENSPGGADRNAAKKGALIYLGITLFCFIFSTIYEYFSHGVYSEYMTLLFLFPFLGGVIPNLILMFFRYPSGTAVSLWNCGIATLGLGSCLRGIFDIYGTTQSLVTVYWYVGGALLAAGLLTAIFAKKPARKEQPDPYGFTREI